MEVLSSGISSVLTWLIHTTLYISILIFLILLLKAITRRRLPAWWHYGLWLLLVARMLMPWVPESRLSMFNYVPVIAELNSYMPTLMELDLNLPPLTDLNFTERCGLNEPREFFSLKTITPRSTSSFNFQNPRHWINLKVFTLFQGDDKKRDIKTKMKRI